MHQERISNPYSKGYAPFSFASCVAILTQYASARKATVPDNPFGNIDEQLAIP